MSKKNLKNQAEHGPKGAARSAFADLLNPTEREMAEMEYGALLANPESAKMVGIPLIAGGLNTQSTKIRLEQTFVFEANDAGKAYCVVYGHVASVDNDRNISGANELYARIPTLEGGAVEQDECLVAVTSGPGAGTYSGVTPGGDIGDTTVVMNGGQPIYLPICGLSLTHSEARPVAQELIVRPIDSAFVQKGTGLIVRAASIDVADDSDDFSLAGMDLASAFAEQGNERHAAALNAFGENHVFTCVWLPQTLSNIAWSPTALAGGRTMTGAAYSAFFADGCAPLQAFRATLTTIYELKSDNYTTSTPNGMSDAGFAMIEDVRVVTPPAVQSDLTSDMKSPQAAAAIAAGKFPKIKAIEHVRQFIARNRKRFVDSWLQLKEAGTFGKVAKGIGSVATMALPLVIAALKGGMHPAMRGPKPIPKLSLPRYGAVRLDAARTEPSLCSKAECECKCVPTCVTKNTGN